VIRCTPTETALSAELLAAHHEVDALTEMLLAVRSRVDPYDHDGICTFCGAHRSGFHTHACMTSKLQRLEPTKRRR
jgi:hypothetical protein